MVFFVVWNIFVDIRICSLIILDGIIGWGIINFGVRGVFGNVIIVGWFLVS